MTKSGIVVSHDKCVFHSTRNYQSVFQRGCAILYHHQKQRRVTVVPWFTTTGVPRVKSENGPHIERASGGLKERKPILEWQVAGHKKGTYI